MRDICKTALCVAALFALAAQASASDVTEAIKSETAAMDRSFDNKVTPPPEKPDYDKIADRLTAALSLDAKQERKLRAVLRGHNTQFDRLSAQYSDLTMQLSREREELMRIRAEIKAEINSIPDVISALLDADQKEDYKKLLLEQQGIKQPIVAEPARQPETVKAEPAAKSKTVIKKRSKKLSRAAAKMAAAKAAAAKKGTEPQQAKDLAIDIEGKSADQPAPKTAVQSGGDENSAPDTDKDDAQDNDSQPNDNAPAEDSQADEE